MKTQTTTGLKMKIAAILLFAGFSTFLNTASADQLIWQGHVVIEKDKTASFGGSSNGAANLLSYMVATVGGSRRNVYCVLVCGSNGCNYHGGGRTSQGPAHEADIECYKETY